jgi:hypothetical protein
MILGEAPVYSSWRAGQTYTNALGGVITIQEGNGVENTHIVAGQQMQYYVTGPENWSRGGWQTRWDIIGGEVRPLKARATVRSFQSILGSNLLLLPFLLPYPLCPGPCPAHRGSRLPLPQHFRAAVSRVAAGLAVHSPPLRSPPLCISRWSQ